MLRLMCITAHPDDECGAFGRTLKLCRDRGIETYVICLTPGQAARHRGEAKSDQELAAMRREEFAAACEILQVSRGIVLDYPDGRLDRLDPHAVAGELARHIREFRPQVLITFGTDGTITGHPDHSMASVFASLAYQWAGSENRFPEQLSDGLRPHRTQKLYFGTASFLLPGRPVSPAPVTAEIEIGAYLETKIAAFHAHRTQAPLFPVFEDAVRRGGSKELFHLAARIDPGPAERETDLFAGVQEE